MDETTNIEIKCRHDELMDIAELLKRQNPKNRNKHPAAQIKRLAEIYRFNGIRTPIVLSKRSNMLVKGHGRLLAAIECQMQHFPVEWQDYETEDQEYADAIADNAIALWADLDLAGINADLPEIHLPSIDLLGIENFVVEPMDKYGDKDADEVPETRDSKIQRGDLFLLGDHRLLCGDATDPACVERLMNGEKADMVFTDPPYNIAENCDGVAQGAPTNKQSKKLMGSEWDKNFKFGPVSKSIENLLSDDATVYICTSQFVAPEIWAWMDKFLDYSGYCVWTKPNPFPSLMKRRWAFCTELVCYGTRGKQVFNYPSEGNALSAWNIAIGEGGQHPTQKPTKVPQHAITHSSNSGQLVTDLFLGSGSTLIACEKTNRRCFGMEIDPHYCDVIIARWEKFTGKKAVLLDKASNSL